MLSNSEAPVEDAAQNGKRGFAVALFFWVTLGINQFHNSHPSPLSPKFLRPLSILLYPFNQLILPGMTIMPDGPFLRPHPAIWRLKIILRIFYLITLLNNRVTCVFRLAFAVSIFYELLLIYILHQVFVPRLRDKTLKQCPRVS